MFQIRKEVQEAYNIDIEYPLAHFIMCVGFFLILTIEQTVLYLQETWASQDTEESEPLLVGSVNVSYQSTDHHHHQYNFSSTTISPLFIIAN